MNRFDEAMERAKHKRSPWHFVLIVVVLALSLGLWFLALRMVEWLHASKHPGQSFANSSHGIGAVLAGTGPLFAVLPVAMVISNVLFHLIPPARNAMALEATLGTSVQFREAQSKLLRASAIIVPISAIISVVGALLPWHP